MLIPGRDDVPLASAQTASGRVLVRSGMSPSRRKLWVVLEWFMELRRLVCLRA